MAAKTIMKLPANASFIRYRASHSIGMSFDFIEMVDLAVREEHNRWRLETEPNSIDWVWDHLGCERPEGRCVVGGFPALADPASGMILASTFGRTLYIVRVPPGAMDEAKQLGYQPELEGKELGGGDWTFDLTAEIEPDWVFGRWLDFERDWLRLVAVQARRGDLPGVAGAG